MMKHKGKMGSMKKSGAGMGGSNNNINGKRGMAEAMSMRSPSAPKRVVPAPTMERTLGPGSRC